MSIDEHSYQVLQQLQNLSKDKLIVGRNLVKAGLKNHTINKVIISLDCETKYVAEIVRLCSEHRIEWIGIDDSQALGKAVGIDVRCLCVGITQ